MMLGRCRISELPAEILDNILGFLPIVEAARTAVLSTVWRDGWSSLTQLNFDDQFFSYIERKYSDSYNSTSICMYIINKVLMQHHGPIRKFVLDFKGDNVSIVDEPNSRRFDFDQWLLFITQKGVEDMKLTFPTDEYYVLPNCVFSCSTLKRLDLYEILVAPTIDATCIFPNVTSLNFDSVSFDTCSYLEFAAEVPMLETLTFSRCEDVSSFNIFAPRLGSLTIQNHCFDGDIEYYYPDGFLPINLDLTSIRTLCLEFNFMYFVKELTRWGPELNVECLELPHIYFPDEYEFSEFIHSFRIFPKLCKLDISRLSFYADISRSKVWEELHSLAKVLKMLHTLKLRSFNGSRCELRFIMMLLACFPTLEKVVIIRRVKFDSNKEFRIMQKLLHFPRASKNAKIVYI